MLCKRNFAADRQYNQSNDSIWLLERRIYSIRWRPPWPVHGFKCNALRIDMCAGVLDAIYASSKHYTAFLSQIARSLSLGSLMRTHLENERIKRPCMRREQCEACRFHTTWTGRGVAEVGEKQARISSTLYVCKGVQLVYWSTLYEESLQRTQLSQRYIYMLLMLHLFLGRGLLQCVSPTVSTWYDIPYATALCTVGAC